MTQTQDGSLIRFGNFDLAHFRKYFRQDNNNASDYSDITDRRKINVNVNNNNNNGKPDRSFLK